MNRIFAVLVFSSFCITAVAQNSSRRQNTFLICGHRAGFYKDKPENSFAAIVYTAAHSSLSPVIVEIDLRKSKDGTLFLMHDDSVNRTTNGSGKIADLGDNYLNSLLLKTSGGIQTTEHIPTFDSVLNFIERKNIIVMLDIKADVWDEAIEKLRSRKLEHKSIFLTFSNRDLERTYALSKEVRISCFITNEKDLESIQQLSIPLTNLIAYINESTSQKLIGKLKGHQMLIMADVNENAMKNLNPLPQKFYNQFVNKRRIDILITDFPVEVSKKLR